jgi:formyl-CoA transferase
MIAHHKAFDDETVAVPAVVPKLSDTPGRVRVRAPMLGEHTDEVLRALGFPEGQIARWRESGVIQ